MYSSRENGRMYANGNGCTSHDLPRWSGSTAFVVGERPSSFPLWPSESPECDNYSPHCTNSIYTTFWGAPTPGPVNPQLGEEQTSWYNQPYQPAQEQTSWYNQPYAWSEHRVPQCSTEECIDDDGVAQTAIKTAFRVLLATSDEFRQSMALRSLGLPSDRNPVDEFYEEWIKEQEAIGERIRELPDEQPANSNLEALAATLPNTPPESPPPKLPHFRSSPMLDPDQGPLKPDAESANSNLEVLATTLPKTPPESPPPKLAHFPSSQTLDPEQAPLKPETRFSGRGQRNIELLQKLREKDAGIADMSEDDLKTFNAPSPTAPTKDIVETLKRQAHRRRKQVHDERAGLSVPEGYEDRARRRHEAHIEVKKTKKTSLPATGDAPHLSWSEIDEERVALFALGECESQNDPFTTFTREEVRKILEHRQYTGENVLALLNAMAALALEQKQASLGGRTLFEHDTDSMHARAKNSNVKNGSDSHPRDLMSTSAPKTGGPPEGLLCNMSGVSYIDDRGPPMQSFQAYVEDASECGLETPPCFPRSEANSAAEDVNALKDVQSARVINNSSQPLPRASNPSWDAASRTGHHGLRRRPGRLDKSTASLYRTPLESSRIERGIEHKDEGGRERRSSAERRKERRRERRSSDRDHSSSSHSVNGEVASPQLSASSNPQVFTERGLRRSVLHTVTAGQSTVNRTSEEAQRAALYLEHLRTSFASMQYMAHQEYMRAEQAEYRAAILEEHNRALNTRVLMAEAGAKAWAREARSRAEAVEVLEAKVKALKDERRQLRSEVEGLRATAEAGWWAQDNRRDKRKGEGGMRSSKEERDRVHRENKSPDAKDVRRKASREEKERAMRGLKDEIHSLKKEIKKLKVENDDVLDEVKRR